MARDAWSFLTDAELRERNLRANFSSLPGIHGFHNQLVTGDPALGYLDYFHSKYVGAGRAVEAVSFGCGDGHLERTLLGLGWRFSSLVGLELNPKLVEFAQAQVAGLPGAGAVRYRTADLNRLALDASSVDLGIFFHSLHHVEALRRCLAEVSRALRPGGKLLVVDYLGPNRLQRSAEHLALCDLFLARLPEAYRIDLSRSKPDEVVLKARCENLPIEGVIANDPSEAVCSEEIEAALHAAPGLELVEERPLGGSLLDPLFMNIAGNFKPEDGVAEAYIQMAMSAEQALLQTGAIRSHYRFMILEKVAGLRRWLSRWRSDAGR